MAIELGEWVPGLRVTVGVTERVEYETNVFQRATGAQDDLISRTVPFIIADWRAAPFSAALGYRAEILRFADLTSQDNEHHIAFGQLRYEGPRLRAGIRDDFTKTTDPPSSELVGRVESTTNVLAPEVEYQLTPRFALGANYAWTKVDFATRDVERLDRDEHAIGGSVFWKFVPRADVRLSYIFTEKSFEQEGSASPTEHNVSVGLRGDLTPKLSSTFRVGYTVRDPDEPDQDNTSTYAFGGGWIYKPTDRTTISLLLDRSFVESVFGTTAFFVNTNGVLTVEQQFTPKLSANLHLSAGQNDYPRREVVDGQSKFRNDVLLGWGAGVQYDIQKWLGVGAEYSHNRRDSNFSTFDYTDDKVAAKVSLQF